MTEIPHKKRASRELPDPLVFHFIIICFYYRIFLFLPAAAAMTAAQDTRSAA